MEDVRAFLVPFLAFLSVAPLPAQSDLMKLLRRVEDRYNKPRTLQFQFEQSQSGKGRITRSESGELYLAKPGRMRWNYASPEGKFFLSDGRFLYYYAPGSGQVTRARIKDSDDMRAPLGFLMGRLDFQRDFKEFRTYPEGPNTYIVATPKSERAPYTQVAFLVEPDARIQLLRVTGQDQSIMVYRFASEKTNAPLAAGLFEFKLPPDAQLVDEDQ